MRPEPKRQTGSLLAMEKLDGAAMFLATKDGDKAIGMRLFAQKLVDEFFLVGLGLKRAIGGVSVLGHRLSVFDKALRQRLDERDKVLAFDFEGIIDEAIEMLVAPKGKMATKNDSIMARKRGYNGGRESFNKAVHGVLLPMVVW